MTRDEYKQRQDRAKRRLEQHGQYDRARAWLPRNPPPPTWTGTPLEWAIEEMPVNLLTWAKSLFP
jgi:hypothetical protein